MFWRMVKGTLFRQKSKMLMIAFTVALGVSLATAMMNVMLGVGDKVNKELKTYGANITVMHKDASILDDLYGLSGESVSNKFLLESEIPKIKQIFWGFAIVDFAPYLERTGEIEGISNKVKIYGTWFAKHLVMPTGEEVDAGIKNLKTWWEIKGEWLNDDDLEGVMVGSLIAGKNNLKVGDTVTFNIFSGNDIIKKKMKIIGIIDNSNTGGMFFASDKTLESLTPYNTNLDFSILIDKKHSKEVEEKLLSIIQKNSNLMLYSYEDDYRMITRAFQYIIIASYIFVGLISCFGILNMTNTLINSVLIRKKEFALLQAVGMTRKQLRNMLYREGLNISIKAICTSSILGYFGSNLLCTFIKDVIRLDFINFKFSIFTILIFSFVLIGIQVLVTELLVRNIEKKSLTERLRSQ